MFKTRLGSRVKFRFRAHPVEVQCLGLGWGAYSGVASSRPRASGFSLVAMHHPSKFLGQGLALMERHVFGRHDFFHAAVKKVELAPRNPHTTKRYRTRLTWASKPAVSCLRMVSRGAFQQKVHIHIHMNQCLHDMFLYTYMYIYIYMKYEHNPLFFYWGVAGMIGLAPSSRQNTQARFLP